MWQWIKTEWALIVKQWKCPHTKTHGVLIHMGMDKVQECNACGKWVR
jgi:hypothetical protein